MHSANAPSVSPTPLIINIIDEFTLEIESAGASYRLAGEIPGCDALSGAWERAR